MFHLSKINGKLPIINSTCTKLKPLDIICLPSEIKMEFTHTGRAPAGEIKRGRTSKSHDKNPMLNLIIQDSQDPDKKMDIEEVLLEAELREHRK